jgi:steroid delta-isomerase-like uncharacterized protein
VVAREEESGGPVAVVRALFDRFNAGDLDAACELASDDFELRDHAAGRVLVGASGLREWLGTFLTAFPDSHAELVTEYREGNHVATEHVGQGTHEGPFVTPAGTIPATGKRVELRFAEFYVVESGHVREMAAYYDTTSIMRQLGLLPPAGGRADRALTMFMGVGVRLGRALGR